MLRNAIERLFFCPRLQYITDVAAPYLIGDVTILESSWGFLQ